MRPRAFYQLIVTCAVAGLGGAAGCRSADSHRRQADESAGRILTNAQSRALGRVRPIEMGRAEGALRARLIAGQALPGAFTPFATNAAAAVPDPLPLDLRTALQAAARNSRAYQDAKEIVFRAALALDLEQNTFRTTYSGLLGASVSDDRASGTPVRGTEQTASAGAARTFSTGASLTGKIAVDLVRLLTEPRDTSLGLLADASISIPLLRGAGRRIVLEPLTQAEREVLYAVQEFERFKQTFAVDVHDAYLGVLQARDRIRNAEDNHRQISAERERAARLADAGRLPRIQTDQARQDELRARSLVISARQDCEGQLDDFKVRLGLPPDARAEMDTNELARLTESSTVLLPGASPLASLTEDVAVRLAFSNRLDLAVTRARIDDARRQVNVAADALRGDVALTLAGSAGESRSVAGASQADARLRLDEGAYSASLLARLPWERTAERNAYRESLIAFEQTVRLVEAAEDGVKRNVRDVLRRRAEAEENVRIQEQALAVARRRVDSTQLLLQAGRAQMRDVLEARDALLLAQDALTAALVARRSADLALLRDVGLLDVDAEGLIIRKDAP